MSEEEEEQKKKEFTEKAEAKAKAEAAKAEETRAEDEKIVEAAKALKEENEKKTELLTREEKLQDRKETLQSLGGGSPAGTKPTKPEETDKEYKDRVMSGK